MVGTFWGSFLAGPMLVSGRVMICELYTTCKLWTLLFPLRTSKGRELVLLHFLHVLTCRVTVQLNVNLIGLLFRRCVGVRSCHDLRIEGTATSNLIACFSACLVKVYLPGAQSAFVLWSNDSCQQVSSQIESFIALQGGYTRYQNIDGSSIGWWYGSIPWVVRLFFGNMKVTGSWRTHGFSISLIQWYYWRLIEIEEIESLRGGGQGFVPRVVRECITL